MSKPNFEQFLDEQLQSQQEEISPSRDLWPGIEHAINLQQSAQQEKAKRNWAMPAFGTAAAAVLVTLVGLNMPMQQDSTQFALISDAYEQQKQSLLVQYQSQPALTDNWKAQLAELEQAEKAIKDALEDDPNNRALLGMLAQVYQQQLDLINKVHSPKQSTVLQHI